MSSEAVQFEMRDAVAWIRLDDGKANALSPGVIEALGSALDRAEKEGAKALVWAGRPGRFSAGFELSIMTQGPEAAMDLALSGADLAVRLYSAPFPVVLAVTGHALAMGAVLCCAADLRVGAEGDFKVGLNEVAIGMTLPRFALEFAQARLSRRHLTRATVLAEIYDPAGACDAGYLDRVVPAEACVDEALALAAGLAEGLNGRAQAGTKRALREETLDRLRQSVSDDRAALARRGEA
ncbi:MAG: crotonase/enoyl-CoA hydratase family protein [Myxococcota bacterium]